MEFVTLSTSLRQQNRKKEEQSFMMIEFKIVKEN